MKNIDEIIKASIVGSVHPENGARLGDYHLMDRAKLESMLAERELERERETPAKVEPKRTAGRIAAESFVYVTTDGNDVNRIYFDRGNGWGADVPAPKCPITPEERCEDIRTSLAELIDFSRRQVVGRLAAFLDAEIGCRIIDREDVKDIVRRFDPTAPEWRPGDDGGRPFVTPPGSAGTRGERGRERYEQRTMQI